jgi:hypothetical protein
MLLSIVVCQRLLLGILLLVFTSAVQGGDPQETSATAEEAPSCSNNGKSHNNTNAQQELLLDLILAEDWSALDETMPNSITQLKQRKAHKCWHKHSTFLQHLVGVHNILRLWGQSKVLGRVGLFHSAYSNSYVNLALLDPIEDREALQSWIGTEAEALVYLYCSMDRHKVVVYTLLTQGYIPTEGLTVPHLRDKTQTIDLSPAALQQLLIFTMADVADQNFGWQDALFGDDDYKTFFSLVDDPSSHQTHHLWPGRSKPGLWMTFVSDLCQVAKTVVDNNNTTLLPPVFDQCRQRLTTDQEIQARDLYWSVIISEQVQDEEAMMVQTLKAAHATNPWIYEPLVLLGQLYLQVADFESALQVTQRALQLQLDWGTNWDKRMSFPAWVAWTKVLHQRAQKQQAWPTSSWEVLNLGLVE